MKVIFLNSFLKDLKKINDKKVKQKVKTLILDLEAAETLFEVKQISKMKGYNIAYRAKIDSFRVGLYSYDKTVEIARIVKRNDIYKVFPSKTLDKS